MALRRLWVGNSSMRVSSVTARLHQIPLLSFIQSEDEQGVSSEDSVIRRQCQLQIRLARFIAILFVFALCAGCAATSSVPNYMEILTLDTRPGNERARDAVRKPHEVMAFYDVKRGDKVADLLTARGYYAVILSHVVGPDGIVYAASAKTRPDLIERIKQPSLANVRLIDGPLAKLALPQDGSLDFVLIHLNYHDLAPDVRGAMNQRVLAALKKGGIYGVVDHSAKDGTGNEATKTLHRIDKLLVIKEVTGAGFKLSGEGNMLRNPEDNRLSRQREHSDRFVLKFERP